MAVQSSNSLCDNTVAAPAPQSVVWVSFGLSESWVSGHLVPVSQQFNHMGRGDTPTSMRALEQGEGDWDILFLGDSRGGRMPELSPLAVLISRIARVRPLGCIVAVAGAATPDEQITLLRAGAAEVMSSDADADQMFRIMDRLVDLLRGRRQYWEQEMLRLVGQLAISVNHEINNPLTGLMGTAELILMESGKDNEKLRRDLNTIIKQCHRIQEVTARLKHLNRLRTVPYGSHDMMIDLIGDLQPAQVTQPTHPPAQLLPSPRILVVDDNPLIIDLIARLFDTRFAIDAAGGACEAMTKIERNHYDLVLIDLILPEMNGLELFRAMRRLKPQQRALLTTAYEGDARVEQAIVEGALGCIYKPFQLEDLETALLDALKPELA